MYEILQYVIKNSVGIFDKYPVNIFPIRQIKLKDITEYSIYLSIHENKIYMYPFENFPYPDRIYTISNDNVISGAIEFSHYIYINSIYKIRFKPLTYSLDIISKEENDFWNPETLINVYSISDIPKGYFTLHNDIFKNISTISTILHREELNDYINKLEYKNT